MCCSKSGSGTPSQGLLAQLTARPLYKCPSTDVHHARERRWTTRVDGRAIWERYRTPAHWHPSAGSSALLSWIEIRSCRLWRQWRIADTVHQSWCTDEHTSRVASSGRNKTKAHTKVRERKRMNQRLTELERELSEAQMRPQRRMICWVRDWYSKSVSASFVYALGPIPFPIPVMKESWQQKETEDRDYYAKGTENERCIRRHLKYPIDGCIDDKGDIPWGRRDAYGSASQKEFTARCNLDHQARGTNAHFSRRSAWQEGRQQLFPEAAAYCCCRWQTGCRWREGRMWVCS